MENGKLKLKLKNGDVDVDVDANRDGYEKGKLV
jgi:hypothetical protein